MLHDFQISLRSLSLPFHASFVLWCLRNALNARMNLNRADSFGSLGGGAAATAAAASSVGGGDEGFGGSEEEEEEDEDFSAVLVRFSLEAVAAAAAAEEEEVRFLAAPVARPPPPPPGFRAVGAAPGPVGAAALGAHLSSTACTSSSVDASAYARSGSNAACATTERSARAVCADTPSASHAYVSTTSASLPADAVANSVERSAWSIVENDVANKLRLTSALQVGGFADEWTYYRDAFKPEVRVVVAHANDVERARAALQRAALPQTLADVVTVCAHITSTNSSRRRRRHRRHPRPKE